MKQSFADRIVVIESPDVVGTGRFEVVIRETKEKIHSRPQDGLAWPSDNPEKEALIINKINAALKEKDLKRAAKS